jgi:N6-L-threonylcarbamoyladenine synthase
MIALGIETSCDDTSVAIVDDERRIISNITSSQIDLHKEFGGVVPEIAARSHAQIVDKLIHKCLDEAKINFQDLDLIAATAGPGLIGGVMVGLMAGKVIASISRKPFIAVNHLEAHALTSRLTNNVDFPYLLILVSGGHCQTIFVNDIGDYRKIGHTIDDALGEAFDKVARMMGLDYPGGPIIEELAKQGNEDRFILPRPLISDKKNKYNFSFSGLKTAVRRLIEDIIGEDFNSKSSLKLKRKDIIDICASFQKTVLEILFNRLQNSLGLIKQEGGVVKTIVISGGVAANRYLYKNLTNKICSQAPEINVIAPPIHLCTDNGAMIAWTGIEKYTLGLTDELNFRPRAKWDFTN